MIFCLEPKIFDHIPKKPKDVVNLTDHIIPDLLRKGVKVFGFEFKDFWEDIGNHDDYHRINNLEDHFFNF